MQIGTAYEDLSPEEKAEVDALRGGWSLTQAAKMEKAQRTERDRRMDAFQWRLQRYEREIRSGRSATDNIADLDAYMQALADVTAQAEFPDNITWPIEPSN